MANSSVPTNTRFLMVQEYPESDDTLGTTGKVVRVQPTPVTDSMKQEMAIAPVILLPLNLQAHPEHVIDELMKLYNAGEKNCVVKIPKNFPFDTQMNLWEWLDDTLPGLMKEKDHETRRLRRLKVYFVKEV